MDRESQHIHFPLEEFDYDAQLSAIRGLLYRQERADQELSDKIGEAGAVAEWTRGPANDHAVDAQVELMHMSCYQAAAPVSGPPPSPAAPAQALIRRGP